MDSFNSMGKFTRDALTKLGGNLVYEFGESDHNFGKADIFVDCFEPWKAEIWHKLHKNYNQSASSPSKVLRQKEQEFPFDLKFLSDDS